MKDLHEEKNVKIQYFISLLIVLCVMLNLAYEELIKSQIQYFMLLYGKL